MSDKDKCTLWEKIHKSRGLSGYEYHSCQDVFSECFDDRQQKIDKLESLLNEAVTALRAVQEVEGKEKDHYAIVDSFLNKSEIKKVRGEEW